MAAAGNLALTALGVVGEDLTLGLDTPFTLTVGRLTAFFAATATAEGALGAGLNSIAQGNGVAAGRFGTIEGSARALGIALKGTRYGEAADAIYGILADATVGESEGGCRAQ